MTARAPRPLAVIDVDGVVADVEHRLHHLRGGHRDWDAFFAAAGDDPPLAAGIQLVRDLAADLRICYLTGRPEHLRRVTERWLRDHELPGGALVMRPEGDHRPARVLKPELLDALVAAGEDISVVVDDDPAVCDAVAARGFAVRRADWTPDAHRDLRVVQEDSGSRPG